MFHEGDLQSGIGLAIQQSKSIVCFVTDHSEESDRWENEWLQDQNIPNALERQAVVLRLEAGSQEAGFLSAFCPVTVFPTVLVIHQGQVMEQLLAGTNKNDFTLRLFRALSGKERALAPTSQSSQPPNPSPASSEFQPELTSPNRTNHEAAADTPQPNVTSPPQADVPETAQASQQTTDAGVRTMLAERATRLAAEKAAAAERAKAAAAERSKARLQEATTTTATTEPSTSSGGRSRENYAAQQVQRKREAKQERERVLRLLENDRIERKEREEQRKAQLQAERQDASQSSPLPGAVTTREDARSSSKSTSNGRCALQVRLFNGSTIRSTFSASDRLDAVRRWIDSERADDDTPYTLKQILTPLPNRSLAESDESKSLADLDLTPSATLVLVPIKNFTTAVGGRGGGQNSPLSGYVVGIISAVVNIVSPLLGLGGAQTESAAGTATTQAAQGQEEAKEEGALTGGAAAEGSGIRIRTLRDQRAERDDGQFYNGNQLNFEPNRPDRDNDEGA